MKFPFSPTANMPCTKHTVLKNFFTMHSSCSSAEAFLIQMETKASDFTLQDQMKCKHSSAGVLLATHGQKKQEWQGTGSPPGDHQCLSYVSIATPEQTSALEEPSVSRTSNLCFRSISNYSFSEFRLSCQTTTYSPGISSAASKPTQ